MSTRGAVGYGTAEQFTARYHHFDSYPTGMGPMLWSMMKRRGPVEALQHILAHDWSIFERPAYLDPIDSDAPPMPAKYAGVVPGICYCHTYCDHKTLTDADGAPMRHEDGRWRKCPVAERDEKWGIYHTLSDECDCPARSEELAEPFTEANILTSWVEYVWLVGEDGMLRIYSMGHTRLIPIGEADTRGEEPDWEAIQAVATAVRTMSPKTEAGQMRMEF